MGSEMCIRDRRDTVDGDGPGPDRVAGREPVTGNPHHPPATSNSAASASRLGWPLLSAPYEAASADSADVDADADATYPPADESAAHVAAELPRSPRRATAAPLGVAGVPSAASSPPARPPPSVPSAVRGGGRPSERRVPSATAREWCFGLRATPTRVSAGSRARYAEAVPVAEGGWCTGEASMSSTGLRTTERGSDTPRVRAQR